MTNITIKPTANIAESASQSTGSVRFSTASKPITTMQNKYSMIEKKFSCLRENCIFRLPLTDRFSKRQNRDRR